MDYKMMKVMGDSFKFLLNRIKERLWVKPIVMCLLSIAGVFFAKTADYYVEAAPFLPDITQDSIEKLLSIISSSMLVIATFAVGSMISAYASASNTATPRSFSLVIADDVSQNALSTFIGAFIFSIVALVVLKNDYYDITGRFALFVLTIMAFVMVITTFIRWVDCIARLGLLGETIEKVEAATAAALQKRRLAPTLNGLPAGIHQDGDLTVYGDMIGYVQHINMAALQRYAEEAQIQITIAALPGVFSSPGRPLAYASTSSGDLSTINKDQIINAFLIGDERKFDDDPRFGLIVLSEIAIRALSPAVNDPGTAIGVMGAFVRLFALWSKPVEQDNVQKYQYDRITVPEISLQDMFDDAFTGIARDGASTIEVAVRLQKTLESLALLGDAQMRNAAISHARLGLARAESKLTLPEDLVRVRKAAKFASVI